MKVDPIPKEIVPTKEYKKKGDLGDRAKAKTYTDSKDTAKLLWRYLLLWPDWVERNKCRSRF